MQGWASFIAAFVVFFLSHSIPVRPPVRAALVRRLGPTGFTLAYSTLSLTVLAWLIVAAGRAPYVPLWSWAPWQNTVVLIVMAAACLLLATAIGRPNPFSFGGARKDPFDPDTPGIVGLCRHPLLVALALWAFAHILPNGNLAHVILFAVFGGFAVLGQWIIDRRKQKQMGGDWAKLWAQTRQVPRRLAGITLRRCIAAVVLWVSLIALHPLVFGVSPLP
ncbi:NnrU family protein [Cognatishimia sp. MH4019]|uniref:NnrU family protein n=1 Tax=Cognatishimia sp. MH4019 TaxID=2854030 RepID=UPI001CD1BF00|nr:NnrU family protein [Cognatishimia sp. MH4019]